MPAVFLTLVVIVAVGLLMWEMASRRRERRFDRARRRRQHRVQRDWFATRLFARSRTRRLTHDKPLDR